MKKLKLEPMRPQVAKAFRYLEVPKELLENEDYADLDDGAKLLYSKMLERAGLSARHIDKFTDENGRLFIIYTVEQMEHDLKHSHPTIVKLTKQLVDKGLIEKVRQGQGKPSRIYIFDFTTAPRNKPEKPTSKEPKPQEVKDFNAIKLENKDLENIDLPSSQPPSDWEDGGVEAVQADVRDQIEYPILCENYGTELADEVVEIITEVRCRDSPKMQIGASRYPMDFVQNRMKSLTCEHVSYVLDNLGRTGPVRNPHNYLLALLFNAPASCNTAVQAVYNENLSK